VKRSHPGSLGFEGVVWSDARVRDDAAESAVPSLTHLEVHSGVRRARGFWGAMSPHDISEYIVIDPGRPAR